MREIAERVSLAGCDACLQKPFDMDTLVGLVSRFVDEATAMTPSNIT